MSDPDRTMTSYEWRMLAMAMRESIARMVDAGMPATEIARFTEIERKAWHRESAAFEGRCVP